MADISVLGVSVSMEASEEVDWETKDKFDIVQDLLNCRKSLSEEKNKSSLIQKVIHQLEGEISNINSYLAEVLDEKAKLEERLETQNLQITKLNEKLTHVDETQSRDEMSLMKQIEDLKKLLQEERSEKMKLKQERDQVYAEIEDLSRSLFEESNKICSDEAKKRHQTELTKKKIEEELEEMKQKAQMEKDLLDSLRKKMDRMSYREKKPKAPVFTVNTIDGVIMGNTTPTSENKPPASPALKRIAISKRASMPVFSIERILANEAATADEPKDPNSAKSLYILIPDAEGQDIKDFNDFLSTLADSSSKSPSKQQQSSASTTAPVSLGTTALAQRMLNQDILPCLKFAEMEDSSNSGGIFLKKSKEDSAQIELTKAVMENRCIIEPLSSPQKPTENTLNDAASTTSSSSSSSSAMCACDLCGKERTLKFRTCIYREESSKPRGWQLMKKSSSSSTTKEWKNICQLCRDRIVSCADLFTFVRNIKMGIRKGQPQDLLRELLKLRIRVNFSRIVSH